MWLEEWFQYAMARHATATVSGRRDGEPIEVDRAMMRLTFPDMADALIWVPAGSEAGAVSDAMDRNVLMFCKLVSPWGLLTAVLPRPARPTPARTCGRQEWYCQ